MFDRTAVLKQQAISSALTFYHVLLAQGSTAEAARLADLLGKADESAIMYNVLAWTAYEADAVTEATLVQARRAHELAGGKDSSIIDTLARVLYRLGKTDEAIKLVKEALKGATPGPETTMLQQCLTDFAAK